jgi:cyclohexanone monooxygenase
MRENLMRKVDVLVVGAGMAGIYSLYKFKGMGFSTLLVEAGGGVGGTWYWNRYPGARCDVESIDYSYSFSEELQREWRWTEKFANQAEILSYFNFVVDKFGLRDDIVLNSPVTQARYDGTKRWMVQAADEIYSSKYLIMATGLLSVPLKPKIPGIDTFKGEVHLTGNWPERPVDFTGKRIGVFGNGSSGMQVVPAVAERAERVTLFQRTAGFAIPMRNGPATDIEFEQILKEYPERRERTRKSAVGTYWSAYQTGEKALLEVSTEERERELEERWRGGGPGYVVAYSDILLDLDANKVAADFVRNKIRQIVKDPLTAAKLMPPADLPIGCKRLCVENGYFETFNRPNVTVVDIRTDPIEAITSRSIKTGDAEHELDMLIMAIGFDAFSGAMLKMNIEGRGIRLRDKWEAGPRNYLGMLMAGFPNLFSINGPCTVAANFFLASEMQVDWLARLVEWAEKRSVVAIEVTEQGETEWMNHIQAVADFVTAANYCETWFRGTNVPGKPAVVMNYLGGLGAYSDYCESAEREGYFHLNFSK